MSMFANIVRSQDVSRNTLIEKIQNTLSSLDLGLNHIVSLGQPSPNDRDQVCVFFISGESGFHQQ